MSTQPPPWSGNAPLLPLSSQDLETYLKLVSSDTLNITTLQQTLSQPNGPLTVLNSLIRLHTSTLPWGSLPTLLNHHLSPPSPSLSRPPNSLLPQDVFYRLITRRLGGHCLEIVPLFASLLLSLGYTFYLTSARISGAVASGDPSSIGFHGHSHIVLIVTLASQKYLVDPQLMILTQAVPLSPSHAEYEFDSIPKSVVRLSRKLLRDVIPNRASMSGLGTWVVDYQLILRDGKRPWVPVYILDEAAEWFWDDLGIMNVWLARAEESYLLKEVVVKRLLLGSESGFEAEVLVKAGVDVEDGILREVEVAGTVQLVDERLLVWRFGEKIVDFKVGSEAERIEVLKKWFGIDLNAEEKEVLKRNFPVSYNKREMDVAGEKVVHQIPF